MNLVINTLVIIATFYLVFTFYNDYTYVDVLNLRASKKTIIKQTQKILSGFDILVSSENVSVQLFCDDVMADRLTEVPDYQNLKKEASSNWCHDTIFCMIQS